MVQKNPSIQIASNVECSEKDNKLNKVFFSSNRSNGKQLVFVAKFYLPINNSEHWKNFTTTKSQQYGVFRRQ